MRGQQVLAGAFVGALALTAPIVRADVDPVSGIDFVRVGAVGNAPYTGGGLYVNNHGRVDYEYSIGKFEVTTAQWVEFMNAAFDRPASDRIPFVFSPTQWSAQATTPNTPGGQRWRVPAGREMLPVGGVDWRTCAIYANWLCHEKGTDRAVFMNGAYDVSTFGYLNGGSLFTDQITRSPGARYWIPSLDEWMKAAHYDPGKLNGDGTRGGWWTYANGSDTPFVYGPPGFLVNGQPTTANSGWSAFQYPGQSPFLVPLGAYATTSPWGLFDAAGGTGEWTEAVFQESFEALPRDRLWDGSAWESSTGPDMLRAPGGGEAPSLPAWEAGIRVASSVPSPGIGSLGMALAVLSLGRSRRHDHEEYELDRIGGNRDGRWH